MPHHNEASLTNPLASFKPYPSPCALTEPQWRTMLLLADTMIPALPALSSSPLYAYAASASPAFRGYLNAVLLATPALATQFAPLLETLQTSGPASLAMTGRWTAFVALAPAERAGVLAGWERARLRFYRALFGAVRWLVVSSFLCVDAGALRAIGYPPAERVHPERAPRIRFERLHAPAAGEELALHADVVVVGSGAGGGVAAARIARAFAGRGLRVYVLERGEHIAPHDFPLSEATQGRLYAGGGVVRSVDGNAAMLAGQTWGGGTTVNYSASLQLPAGVREEWARDFGLAFATGKEFQACLDR